jgi:fructose-bisphosphate aldolase, class I
MDSRTGKKIRMGRILRPNTGRAIVVAASHGVLTGAPKGLSTAAEARTRLLSLHNADAVMVAPGMVELVEDLFVGRDSPGLVVELDWKSWNRAQFSALSDGGGEGVTAQLSDLESLMAAGVDAVMSYLYVGQLDPELERREIERNATYARQCERLGLVLIVEPRSAREGLDPDASSPSTIAAYSRIASEIGADLVKCVWPGSVDGLAEVTAGVLCPVLLAGGPGQATLEDACDLASQAMAGDAAGVMFGRKIYQSENPPATLLALRDIVHGPGG